MGKTSLLREIPKHIYRASILDFEDCRYARDIEMMLGVAATLAALHWHHPLFVGNAAGASDRLAKVGYHVIGLHCPDHAQYLRKFDEREEKRGRTNQGDHWPFHNELFHVRMPRHGIQPFLIDTMSNEFDDQPDLVAIAIRDHFQLKASLT